jgi:hypothetical protein
VDLGQVQIPGGFGAFSSETADWAYDKLVYTVGASSLSVWASRLTPATLIQSPFNSLRVLAGNVNKYSMGASTLNGPTAGLSSPKFAAYSTGAAAAVQALSGSPTSLTGMNKNWLLAWYGKNSHFYESKYPLGYKNIGQTNSYQADAPVLFIFQNTPSSIRQSTSGGLEFTFSQAAGYVVMLPLYGRNLLAATQTDAWSGGLPADVVQQIGWWSTRLCDYPVTAVESYSSAGGSDTATIRETITYIPVCAGGVRFAPIPPALGIVKDALPVSFSGAVVDGKLPTEFGPSLGIENVSEYTWTLADLHRIADTQRITTDTGQAPQELLQSIGTEVDRLAAAGHQRPWIFIDGAPRHTGRGDVYWVNPADTMTHLSEAALALPDGTTRQKLITYLRSERQAFPPETVYDLNLSQGTIRPSFSAYWSDWDWNWNVYRTDVHLKRVGVYNFYALSKFYDATGDPVPATVIQRGAAALQADMAEQDWASFYWFKGYDDRRVAVVNVNRNFAGMVGLVRLAAKAGDLQTETLARAQLAKAAVLRLSFTLYPRYLYNNNLVQLPADPAWHTKGGGHLFNFSWRGADDDARQMTTINQFGTFLFDTSAFGEWGIGPTSAYMIAYRDLTPELGRFLSDHAKNDASTYARVAKQLFPHWYTAYIEAMLGGEHNMSHPIDGYQLFLANAYLIGEAPAQLMNEIDIPWLQTGDLFHLTKLAETIRAYRGSTWNDALYLNVFPGSDKIFLNWKMYGAPPPGLTYTIDYIGPGNIINPPITGITSTSYVLTGLANNSRYRVTVSAVSGGSVLVKSAAVDISTASYFRFIPKAGR